MVVDSVFGPRTSGNAAAPDRRRSRHRRRRLWRRVITSAVVVAVVSVVGAAHLFTDRPDGPDVIFELNGADVAHADTTGLSIASSHRPNYRYSVVPGGVRSTAEI